MTYFKVHVLVRAFDMCIASVTNREPIKNTYGYLYSKKKVQIRDLWKKLDSLKINTWQFILKELVITVSCLLQEVTCTVFN